MRFLLTLSAALLVWTCPLAQQSPNYILSEWVFNAGGHPADGVVRSSGGYRMTLDSIGEMVVGPNLRSNSYVMAASFGAAYPPPVEVRGVLFGDESSMSWNADKSVGTYNLYRDLVSNVYGLEYGVCFQYGVTGESTTDSTTPPAGDGYFYLVTAVNRLNEEGTKGADSNETERANSGPCP